MRKLVIATAIIAFIFAITYVLYTKREIFTAVSRPVLNVYGIKDDGSEEMTDILFITHPFSKKEHEKIYNEKKSELCSGNFLMPISFR